MNNKIALKDVIILAIVLAFILLISYNIKGYDSGIAKIDNDLNRHYSEVLSEAKKQTLLMEEQNERLKDITDLLLNQ